MTDWHSHILPGIDDGPPDAERSLRMAVSLATAGFTTVYCTPHMMRGCFEATNEQVRNGVATLQGVLDSSRVRLTLVPGREYCLDEYLLPLLEDPLPLGESREVLIEIPLRISGDMVRELLYRVVRTGLTPVIAHPERCPLLEPSLPRTGRRGLVDGIASLLGLQRPGGKVRGAADASGNTLLDYLRDLGCSFQGNLGSFNGFYGARAKAVAEEFRRLGVYDRYGSDLHAPEHARTILGSAV